MIKAFSKAFLAISMVFVANSYAMDKQPVNIAFTLSMPPYVTEDLSAGVEREVIEASMTAAGMTLGTVRNVHYLRAVELLKSGRIDAIVSNLNNYSYNKMDPKPYASEPMLNYVDCAITLTERNLSLTSIDDYHDKLIWAFKSARSTLGAEFEKMAVSNPYYTEDFNQEKQVEMIVSKRIDIAISDRNIFNARVKQLGGFTPEQFSYHQITVPTPRALRFRDEKLVELFNKGIKIIKQNGVYNKIFDAYKDSYSATCSD